MNIKLVHFIIPCIDSNIARNFYKRVFGLTSRKNKDKIITVKVNENLKFELRETEEYTNNHYTFEVDQDLFNTIITNIKKEELFFGNDINQIQNKKIKETSSKSEIFLIDPNSHLLQIYSKKVI
jgi:extradiol dioxygenase family protein